MAEQKLIKHNHMEESCFRPKPCPKCTLDNAAFDLLEACKEMVIFYGGMVAGGVTNEAREAVEKAEAAIAKAEKVE